jgi:nicotinate-nucleotide adenylyltransferase
VLFVVARRHVFKEEETLTSAEDRFALVEATLAAEPDFQASRIELERPGLSYTIDTVRELEARHPEAELFFIIGGDTIAELPLWKDARELARRLTFLAYFRQGHYNMPTDPAGFRIIRFEAQTPDVSSTDVRAALASGRAVSALLPPGVEALIRSRGLYGVAEVDTADAAGTADVATEQGETKGRA